MNLQEFVTETLSQITRGVAEAKNVSHNIAPALHFDPKSPPIHRGERNVALFMVDFDVAVSVTEKTEVGGSGGITVVSVFKAHGKAERSGEESTVSRVRFNVPISYE